jgi:hypothetical protein
MEQWQDYDYQCNVVARNDFGGVFGQIDRQTEIEDCISRATSVDTPKRHFAPRWGIGVVFDGFF